MKSVSEKANLINLLAVCCLEFPCTCSHSLPTVKFFCDLCLIWVDRLTNTWKASSPPRPEKLANLN